jgi:hypothetical protein
MATPMHRSAGAALALLLACAAAAHAQELTVSNLEHYTDNRGWNEAGLGPTHQVIVTATVTPSGMPTLVFAEKDGARYVFQVMLEDLEGGALENRSLSFSDPYTVPH